ncbi:MAG: hypothetical protein AAF662_03560 [Pseudomonadota bacterium]
MLKKALPGQEPSLQTHYLLTRVDAQPLQWLAEQPYLLAARSELVYKQIDVSGVPVEAQQRYLDMQALKHSPYEDFAKMIVPFSEQQRMMWIWDAQWERDKRAQLPPPFRSAPIIPETLMHPSIEEGANLLSCSAGSELQVWLQGCLMSSRWFESAPDPEQLTPALRAAGLESLSSRSEAVDWLPRPWSEQPRDWSSILRDERILFTSVVVFLLFLLSLHLGSGLVMRAKSAWAESRIESVSEAVQARVDERSRAERQRDVNLEWLSLFSPVTQLEVAAEFAAALEGTDYEILDWRYADGKLDVTIRSEGIDSRDVVSRLEKRDLFHALRIEPGRREGESAIRIEIPDLNRYRLQVVE